MKTTPVNGAEAFEEIKRDKTTLALALDLISMRKQLIGKGARTKNGEDAFKENVG